MRKAFYISLFGHFAVISFLLIVSWAFSRPTQHSYPRTISASFVAKSSPKAKSRAQRKVAPPKPRKLIKPVQKSKANERAVKKTQRRNQPQPAISNAKKNASAVNTPALKIDAPEFPFPEYLALIQYRIESQWRPPANAGGGLLTTVYFRIDRNGRLSNVKVAKACGNFVVDQAALRAVYGADPLPALPPESGLSSLGVHFDFVVY